MDLGSLQLEDEETRNNQGTEDSSDNNLIQGTKIIKKRAGLKYFTKRRQIPSFSNVKRSHSFDLEDPEEFCKKKMIKLQSETDLLSISNLCTSEDALLKSC